MSVLDIALVTGAYLLGAVPFGMLVAKVAGIGDPRRRGSGNIGATNVTRLGGKGAGAATLLCDIAKGWIPVWVAVRLGTVPEVPVLAAAAAVLGHIYPVYLGFRGGKGVATGFGVLMPLSFPTAFVCFLIWIGAYALSRISAVGALAAYGSLPAVAWWLGPEGLFLPFACALAVLVLVRHADNVRQLMAMRKTG